MAIENLPLADEHEDESQAQPHPHGLHHHTVSSASTASIDVEAWTAQALASLKISPGALGTGNPLTIPLDDATTTTRMKLRSVVFDPAGTGIGITPPRRPPSRRDSMKKREELLKGKEGSRQRRRWENGKSAFGIPTSPLLEFEVGFLAN